MTTAAHDRAGRSRPARATDRRSVLAGAVAVAAGSLTAACASTGTTATASPTAPEPAAPEPAPPEPAGPGAPAGPDLGPVDDVPIGGGVLAGGRVVVVRPAADVVAAFSVVCPHRGCAVDTVREGLIACPCHGSRFRLDGSVARGPATAPLTPVPVTVSGGRIIRT